MYGTKALYWMERTRCIQVHYVWFSQFWSHFRRTMHCLPQRLKSTYVWNFFERSRCEGVSGVRKNFKQLLILVFEVIVQPPKTHFLTFSRETKIMKITHSGFIFSNHCLFTVCQIIVYFSGAREDCHLPMNVWWWSWMLNGQDTIIGIWDL